MVASIVRSWATFASTVASMLEVGSTGAGEALEQARTRIPISTVRTTGGFKLIPGGLDRDILSYAT